MKKILVFVVVVAFSISCSVLNQVTETSSTAPKQLTQTDIANGLKNALTIGSGNTVSLVSALNGYYGNPLIKIPFPEEAKAIKDLCNKVPALKTQVTQFEEKLNRAAEDAAVSAKAILVNSISQMTITDAVSILKGKDDAATQYLRAKNYNTLYQQFKPIVTKSTDKVMLAKYWTPLATKYNSTVGLATGKKINVDLNDYVTKKALDGLFIMIAKEETKIRVNANARVNDLLRRVFGSSYNPHNN